MSGVSANSLIVNRLCRLVLALAVGAVAAVGLPAHAAARPAPTFAYATMADGTQIAVVVSYPRGFSDVRRWPALLMMDGYEGGGGAIDPAEWRDRYVLVHASVRGTGCSGGHFDLFDRTTAYDGRDLIDHWIPGQSWSNGRVGIIGHSYPGLTGFAIAETNPHHLDGMAVSGLIDDLYSGLSYPGGIPNGGFTLVWTELERPFSEQTGNLDRYADANDQRTCAHNVALRPPPDASDDPVLNGTTTTDEGVWWSAHSLGTFEAGLRAPTMITQQYQDEQTGPQGGYLLWRRLPHGVPKRLVLTNGVHDTNVISAPDEQAWMDCWVIRAGHDCGTVTAPNRRVDVHFETTGPGNVPFDDHVNSPVATSDYPDPSTRWSRWYLHGDGRIDQSRPGVGEAPRTYVTTPEGRQSYLTGAGVADAFGSTEGPETVVDDLWADSYGPPTIASGPDELVWRHAFARTTTLSGPIPVRLWVSSTAPDTDVFVELVDEAPDGSYSFLQRGMLRASYRAVDAARGLRIAQGPARGEVEWFGHDYTGRSLLTPSQPYLLRFDIPPVGAVFRPGHHLLVMLYSPPAVDEFNAYGSAQPPAANTVLDSPRHPSSLLLPLLAHRPPVAAHAPACGDVVGVRCTRPA